MPIHPTAIIDPKAELDGSVEVGPYCVIDANVRVSAGCRLYHGVYLTGWTQIGENCELHPGAIVGHIPQDTAYGGERTCCHVGCGTIIREYVTIHRGTKPGSATVIGENCFLMAGSHIGHNCVLGDHVTLANDVLLGGYVKIGDRANLGGGAGVHQFVRVGELVMAAGASRVTMDIVPFAIADAKGRIAGVNRIGLKRAETPPEHVREIREAYRTLFGLGLPFREAVERLAETVKSPAGQRLLAFLQTDSQRGIAGRSRSRKERPSLSSDWE